MVLRAQVVLQGGTGIPEDRFVNTWHFRGAGSLETAAPLCHQMLEDFYSGTDGGAFTPVGAYLSEFVQRTAEVRVYDLQDPIPRVPEISTFQLPAHPGAATADLPEEVAACLTMEAAPPITRRRRGRLYLGPLNMSATTAANTSTPIRVSAQFQGSVAAAATRVINAGGTLPIWTILSPTDATDYLVVTGYIDDAFDTQRRRGPDPTNRQLFPLP